MTTLTAQGRRRRAMAGGGMAGVGVLVAAAAWACTITMPGGISLNPVTGPVGTSVTVTGTNHLPFTSYDVKYLDPSKWFAALECHASGSTVATATTGAPSATSTGSYTTTFVIPATSGTPATGPAAVCDQETGVPAGGVVGGAHAFFTVTS